MSTSRPGAAGPRTRTRPHPAVVERRRAVARAQGRRRRSGALLVLGTLAVAAVLWWIATGPLVAVHGVSVSGYDRSDRGALTKALETAAEEGTVLSPASGAMAAAAREFPWVDSISVARSWPRSLSVRVVPATPVAVAAFEDQAVLVSAAGRVLGIKDGTSGLGWLKLSEAPPAAGGTLPAGARAELAFMAAAAPDVARRIRRLHPAGDGTIVGSLTGGPELRLGAPERMPAKAQSLGLLLAALSAEEESTASYIDLTIPENPALGPVE